MPCILLDSKICYDRVICKDTKLKISGLMNIDNLNYIYANIVQQLDQLSWFICYCLCC